MIGDEAEGARCTISTKKGVIAVAGTVLSKMQAKDIQSVPEDLQGVKKADNYLTVR